MKNEELEEMCKTHKIPIFQSSNLSTFQPITLHENQTISVKYLLIL